MRIESERLVLRPYSLNDVGDVVETANDFFVSSLLTRINYPFSEEHAQEWISQSIKGWSKRNLRDFHFGIESLKDGKLVGDIGLYLDSQKKKGEIAYWLGRKYWGKGYAHEAVSELIDFGFSSLGVEEIKEHVFDCNASSQKLLERFGFYDDGLFRYVRSCASGWIHSQRRYVLKFSSWAKEHVA